MVGYTGGEPSPFSFANEGEKLVESTSTISGQTLNAEDINKINHRIRELEKQNRKKKKNPKEKPLYKKNQFQDRIKRLT